MKITSIEPQKKNPHRFNIFIDGQFTFGADEDLVINRRLVMGKEISEKDLEKLFFEAEIGKLMERMYRLFNIRGRSEKEVRNYLKELNFKRKMSKARAGALKNQEELSEKAIDFLIARLKQKGMINDLEFAKAWIEARRKSKQKGIRALKMELFQKGIDKEIIDELLVDSTNEEELAKTALEKKIKSWKNLESLETRKKATDFLLRHGFDYSIIKSVIEKELKKGYNS